LLRYWTARKHAFWAAQAMAGDGKELMATDVAVPISRLADCITETKKDLDASSLFCPIVGHVGDGNRLSFFFISFLFLFLYLFFVV
jgi:D-lactate dehydrogenase (cytochrome)